MKKLKINSTDKTPEIDFNPSNGEFVIAGISVPEDAISFYQPILVWLNEYAKKPSKKTELTIKLAYVNTSSLQTLYDLLMRIDSIDTNNFEVIINWYYLEQDEDMKDVGVDLQDAINTNFSFHAVVTE